MPNQNPSEPTPTPEPIDVDRLLTCIPAESSDGLPRDAIHDAYMSDRPGSDDAAFDAALHRLETQGHVRTTTRRIFGTRVPYYRQSSR